MNDAIYEGVLEGQVCGRCRISRPDLRVVLYQITPGGQFHMRLLKDEHAICGVDQKHEYAALGLTEEGHAT